MCPTVHGCPLFCGKLCGKIVEIVWKIFWLWKTGVLYTFCPHYHPHIFALYCKRETGFPQIPQMLLLLLIYKPYLSITVGAVKNVGITKMTSTGQPPLGFDTWNLKPHPHRDVPRGFLGDKNTPGRSSSQDVKQKAPHRTQTVPR